MPPNPQSWALVVPVKRLDVAKTRLALDPALRAELALAMAVDTVTACAGTGALVVVVTDDDRAAAVMGRVGAHVVPDVPDAGLNAALRHGAEQADEQQRGIRVAAVSSDLPAAIPAAINTVLAAALSIPVAVVADAPGTGTTVLATAGVRHFSPSFGAGSHGRHVAAGAADLSDLADPRVRRDVDTLADLAAACSLGCGPATTAFLAAHGDVPGLRLQ